MLHTSNARSQNGWSPLLFACDEGHVQVVQSLLKCHARVDVFDEVRRALLALLHYEHLSFA